MDSIIKTYFENLEAKDKNLQIEAFQNIIKATKGKVDWAYEVWDQLLEWLTDPDKRMLRDFPALWEVTNDSKFVTARHSLQSIWKVGLAGPEQREMVLTHIIDRFKNGMNEKHYTLIRYDLIVGLRKLYDELKDKHIKKIAMELIESEEDSKYQKKYLSAWK
ncbi:hypothetical protein [Bacillus atrophaeus]|uniref:hypothetical protein n=1 Tax=Bacillus atrophaeus TaxID=1452 RepID=UPI000D02689E|nr:hypothetical protein [Bacillus atrophaeus]PRR89483.1 hypothetical protein C6W23_09540 [Bacillus atrophaeus]